MQESLEPQISYRKETLNTEERNKMQKELIELFCAIQNIGDPERQQTCAIDWIEKYADNFDQLDGSLVDGYRHLVARGARYEEKVIVLKKIQDRLIELDATYQ